MLWLCAAMTLRQLVPQSILRGRWIIVLVCYLDDSGKDPQNPVTLLGGYVARDVGWEAFETAVEPWFDEFGVRILHAKELRGGRGDFRGWTVLRKQAFVSRVCQARDPHVMMGVSVGIEKVPFAIYRASRAPRPVASPYGYCVNVILNWVLLDMHTGAAANNEGVAFILESGHENNGEVEKAFHEIREQHGLQDVLRSIFFVPKDGCRAVQLADLLAFHARRDDVAMLKARDAGKSHWKREPISKLLRQGLLHRETVATRFFADEELTTPAKPALFPSDW
jgi:hypothetical protein